MKALKLEIRENEALYIGHMDPGKIKHPMETGRWSRMFPVLPSCLLIFDGIPQNSFLASSC